jgi:hypothetical protein
MLKKLRINNRKEKKVILRKSFSRCHLHHLVTVKLETTMIGQQKSVVCLFFLSRPKMTDRITLFLQDRREKYPEAKT